MTASAAISWATSTLASFTHLLHHLCSPPCKAPEPGAWKSSPYWEHLDAAFGTLCWRLKKQLVTKTWWTSRGFIHNIFFLTTSPCWPLTHRYPMQSHLKAWTPSVFTNPFIKSRICSSDTKYHLLFLQEGKRLMHTTVSNLSSKSETNVPETCTDCHFPRRVP